MDINIAYIIAVIAILVRIYMIDGYTFTPATNVKKGQFQMNIILTVLVGLVAAFPIIAAIDLTGGVVVTALAIFLGVYGAPSIVDRIGSKFVPEQVVESTVTKDAGETAPQEEFVPPTEEEGP